MALVSPAGPPNLERVDRGANLLRRWGFLVDDHRPVADPHLPYLAGSDEARLAEFNAALRDPRVRAVCATRGGYGTQRIVDRLDFAALRRDPKPIVGFSDLTAVHAAVWRHCRQVTIYGPGLAWDNTRLDTPCAEALRRLLTDPTARPVLRPRPGEPTAALVIPGPPARGRLLGGNLSMLSASVGTPDQVDLRGAVLLLEDVGEAPYRVDRMLTQLRRAGVFAGLRGVAVGQFTGGDPDGTTLVQVLTDRLGGLGVPVLGGLPLGHGTGQVATPLGVDVRLDTAAGEVAVLEPTVQ